MSDDDIDLISETRFIPRFLETAVESFVLELRAMSDPLAPQEETLIKEWERYVRWRAHVTRNPALLENIATTLDAAAAQLRRARSLMAGREIGGRETRPDPTTLAGGRATNAHAEGANRD